MVDYKNCVYDQDLFHFALIGDEAYEEVIPTSSQILSKLCEYVATPWVVVGIRTILRNEDITSGFVYAFQIPEV